ncbi:hypothetical protein AAG906_000378 [Vitis piasezkii]
MHREFGKSTGLMGMLYAVIYLAFEQITEWLYTLLLKQINERLYIVTDENVRSYACSFGKCYWLGLTDYPRIRYTENLRKCYLLWGDQIDHSGGHATSIMLSNDFSIEALECPALKSLALHHPMAHQKAVVISNQISKWGNLETATLMRGCHMKKIVPKSLASLDIRDCTGFKADDAGILQLASHIPAFKCEGSRDFKNYRHRLVNGVPQQELEEGHIDIEWDRFFHNFG